jgi:hypothetical protein
MIRFGDPGRCAHTIPFKRTAEHVLVIRTPLVPYESLHRALAH